MVDDAKIKELTEHIHDLLDVHQRKHENTLKLFEMCLYHLKDRRRLIPPEVWEERLELINVLEDITK